MDYFGALEDVAIFKMKNIPASSIRSKVRNLEMIDTPVGSVISNVLVVNERQMLFEKNELVYEVKLTRGVIFIFEDGHELSFEKNIWFSEDINVEKGYNLIERFTSTDEFVEGWSGDYHGECTREILSLK